MLETQTLRPVLVSLSAKRALVESSAARFEPMMSWVLYKASMPRPASLDSSVSWLVSSLLAEDRPVSKKPRAVQKAHKDWCKSGKTCMICDVSDGRGSGIQTPVPSNPCNDSPLEACADWI